MAVTKTKWLTNRRLSFLFLSTLACRRCTPNLYFLAMEKPWRVEFRNVGSSYFPQSRVECHYSMSSEHTWASNDWIGLFKVKLFS